MKIYFILLVARCALAFDAKIFRGTTVTSSNRHLFKHQVKLITSKTDGKSYGCGASIIAPRVILTAGHCLADGIVTSVFLGLLDQSKLRNVQQQIVDSRSWRVHQAYDSKKILNDIAVLWLPSRITYSDTIGQIALPPRSACPSYAGKSVMISGWGYVDNTGVSPSQLQYTNVLTSDPAACSRIFGSFDRNSMICADASVAGTCQGDSGGPMTMNLNGVPTVIGCVSYGAVGCEHNYNRVFTCVSNYIDWIYANSNGLL